MDHSCGLRERKSRIKRLNRSGRVGSLRIFLNPRLRPCLCTLFGSVPWDTETSGVLLYSVCIRPMKTKVGLFLNFRFRLLDGDFNHHQAGEVWH